MNPLSNSINLIPFRLSSMSTNWLGQWSSLNDGVSQRRQADRSYLFVSVHICPWLWIFLTPDTTDDRCNESIPNESDNHCVKLKWLSGSFRRSTQAFWVCWPLFHRLVEMTNTCEKNNKVTFCSRCFKLKPSAIFTLPKRIQYTTEVR